MGFRRMVSADSLCPHPCMFYMLGFPCLCLGSMRVTQSNPEPPRGNSEQPEPTRATQSHPEPSNRTEPSRDNQNHPEPTKISQRRPETPGALVTKQLVLSHLGAPPPREKFQQCGHRTPCLGSGPIGLRRSPQSYLQFLVTAVLSKRNVARLVGMWVPRDYAWVSLVCLYNCIRQSACPPACLPTAVCTRTKHTAEPMRHVVANALHSISWFVADT